MHVPGLDSGVSFFGAATKSFLFTHRALGGVAVCTQVRADRVRCNDGQAARRGKDSGHGNGQAPEHDVGYVDVCKE